MIQFINWPVWSELDREAVKKWLIRCALDYKMSVRALSYTFLDDASIEEMNRSFLDHSYPTDIITFDYSDKDNLEGEIFIGQQVVRANAEEYGVGEDEELCRVMVHGILHMIGFDDHNEKELLSMRDNEDKCLFLRPKILRNK